MKIRSHFKTKTWVCPGGIMNRCPSHLSWLLSMWRSSDSTRSSFQVTELLTLSLKERPATLQRKPISAACICNLVLSVMTTGESMNVDRPVNRELLQLSSVFTTIDQYINCITAEAAPIRLSISHSFLPSHVNKTPRYLLSIIFSVDCNNKSVLSTGMSEKEKQLMEKLKELVKKQRDEIRAKEHELTLKNDDVEALQLQQNRLIKINQDLRHRVGQMEGQGKALVQQRVELEAAALARQQELGGLRLEVSRLRRELQDMELDREVAQVQQLSSSLPGSGTSPAPSSQTEASAAEPDAVVEPSSVWAECVGDAAFRANCFELDRSFSEEKVSENKDTALLLLSGSACYESEEDEAGSSGQESDTPHFTLQELRDVLQERNELKAQVFLLQEELAYYKTEDFEGDCSSCAGSPSPEESPAPQPESGIRRLIFTAIMPMVAAGLISDDPTLMPIRRLVSFV